MHNLSNIARKRPVHTDCRTVDISSAVNMEDALEQAGANWDVFGDKIQTETMIDIPTHKAIIRQNSDPKINKGNNIPLGIVGIDYSIMSNSQAVSIFDFMVKQHDVKFDTYEEWDHGKMYVFSALSMYQHSVRENDDIGLMIKMYNSHDGSKSWSFEISGIRFICGNGMIMKSHTNYVAFRHTSGKDDRIKNAMTIMAKSGEAWQTMIDNAQVMNQKRLDTNMVDNFLNELLKIDVKTASTKMLNKKADILDRAYSGIGNTGESIWDLYNGVTEHVDHGMDAKSGYFGAGYTLKDKALTLALKYATA